MPSVWCTASSDVDYTYVCLSLCSTCDQIINSQDMNITVKNITVARVVKLGHFETLAWHLPIS